METFLTFETPKKKQSDIASWHPFLSQTRSLSPVCKEARVWFLMVEGQAYLQISHPPFTFSSPLQICYCNLLLQTISVQKDSSMLFEDTWKCYTVYWHYFESPISVSTIQLSYWMLPSQQLSLWCILRITISHLHCRLIIVILFICFLMVLKIFGCHL